MPIEISSIQEKEYGGMSDKKCGEKHKHRVANATLELSIDVSTDFNCSDE